MIEIGSNNQLRVAEEMPFAYRLTHESDERQVLLPTVTVKQKLHEGDIVNVFVNVDEDGNLTASMQQPKVTVGQVALLNAKGVTDFGAFFDWGLERDLLVLKRDQERPIAEGMDYLVHVYLDENTQRVLGSTRLHYFYPEKVSEERPLTVKQPIKATVYAKTELGYKVMIDGCYLGLLFLSDALKSLRTGESVQAFVKQIRSDGKIDVTMLNDGVGARLSLEQQIIEELESFGGLLTVTDKSSPEEIYSHFKVSKGAYKKAIGKLYKQKRIVISKDSIKLVE
ncbi:S1 RNA-binding domain-containing protein [Alteromonas facilis]|uniref:CvfB family protein n=1 Tax=Alteromonas facilis TaxID=2048004 RepID=UPI000C28AAF4|nr:S1-like domain-containing RNA-binding protein [Alteromonas facilis]